ncbi:MAG TPA: hypothetical protein VLB76_09240 [Thermoanaerobaculia bacterium]|nr:hypothetical protein [Thermoanaerobaculia bacterium]
MSCMPRVRLVLAVTALLTLLIVPMAGARTVGSPSIHPADGDWIGGVLSWAQNLVGLHRPGHAHGQSGRQTPNQKTDSTINAVQSGGCIDPLGRPRPCY